MRTTTMMIGNRAPFTAAALLTGLLSGCSLFAYTNTRAAPPPTPEIKAALRIVPGQDWGSHHKALVILALSGGGSRAAYWSAMSMLKLAEVYHDQDLDLLKEVDAMSSVSGGSLPAAYYAISRDPQDTSGQVRSDRVWDQATVRAAMSKDYRRRWLLNWFWPANALRFWFTAFDRTDIMAQTLADNLFDTRRRGVDLRFADLNPERPYLIINATNGTTSAFVDQACASAGDAPPPGNVPLPSFGDPFTFTTEDFGAIGSNLGDYEISRAVMASATFPGVFNYMTLKDFTRSDADHCHRFRHLFDGGNRDNLGLETVGRIIDINIDQYDRVAVVLVDSYVESQGVSSRRYDGRGLAGHFVDTDFLDSFDSLLSKVRYSEIDRLMYKMRDYKKGGKQMVFYHVKFDNVQRQHPKLFAQLNSIKTDFKIDEEGTGAIDKASALLFTPTNPCLGRIRQLVTTDAVDTADPYCTYDLEP